MIMMNLLNEIPTQILAQSVSERHTMDQVEQNLMRLILDEDRRSRECDAKIDHIRRKCEVDHKK